MGCRVRGTDKSQRIWLKGWLGQVGKWKYHLMTWWLWQQWWWWSTKMKSSSQFSKVKISAHRIEQETHMELSTWTWSSATCSMQKTWTSYLEFHEQGNINDRGQQHCPYLPCTPSENKWQIFRALLGWAVVIANKALTEEAQRASRHHSLVWSPGYLSWIRGHC